MKYAIGDTVTIKDIEWYNANANEYGDVHILYGTAHFTETMSQYCGKTTTIVSITPSRFSDGKVFFKLEGCNGYNFLEDYLVHRPFYNKEIPIISAISEPDCDGKYVTFKIGDKVGILSYEVVHTTGHIASFYKVVDSLCPSITNTYVVVDTDKGKETRLLSGIYKISNNLKTGVMESISKKEIEVFCGSKQLPTAPIVQNNLIPQKQNTIKLKEEIYQKFELPKIASFKLNQN
jgi:hypothetical protein